MRMPRLCGIFVLALGGLSIAAERPDQNVWPGEQ